MGSLSPCLDLASGRRGRWPLRALVLFLAALCSAPTSALSRAGSRGAAQGARVEAAPVRSAAPSRSRADIGFRTHALLVEHYEKHGREFGRIDTDEYLRRAQRLRDRPAGGDVLEAIRPDGMITRFDRGGGAFIVFNRHLVISTFFRPRQGEVYYRRQLKRRSRSG